MKHVEDDPIRHVPDEVHRTLKARAAQEGMTLSDYLLREVRQLTERPTNRELFERDAREPVVSIRRPRSSSGRCAASDRRRRLGRTSPGGGGSRFRAAVETRHRTETTLHVPHLFDIEVLHGLRRSALRGLMADARLAQAVALPEELQAVRYPHDRLLRDIWRLRHGERLRRRAARSPGRSTPRSSRWTPARALGARRVRFELLRAG